MRKTEWYWMETSPDYDGSYEVETNSGLIDASFVDGSWQGANTEFIRWRGKKTILKRVEADELRKILAMRHDHRQEAAAAAVELGRAARERAANNSKLGAVKGACKYFHVAIGLGATLQSFDQEFMKQWWPRLKSKPKRKLEEDVRRFLDGAV